jgi:hypothetical protein
LLEVHGERRGREVQEMMNAAALEPHRGRRAQRGRLLDARIKGPRLLTR